MASANAIFRTDDVTLTGDLAGRDWRAASGNTLTASFCRACGSPVVADTSARPWFRTIRLGFLDPGHDLSPAMAIWTGEAPDWACIDAAIGRTGGHPSPARRD